MYSVIGSELTITTKEWGLRKHQKTMLDIWADPERLLLYKNNQKVRHLTGPEYLLLAKSIKNIITDFFYPMDECLSELEKKMLGKIGVSSVSWAPPSVHPEFYKRGYSAILKTASTADNIKTSMPLADLKTKKDQEGNIAKLSAVTQVLEIMTWLYKRNTNKTKISDAFVYAAYTHSIWYISLMHAMKLYFSDNWSIKQKIARKKGN